jgi:hypothetical protein
MCIALLLTLPFLSYANNWIQKADCGGQERDAPVGFSIYGKGYIGTGGTNYEGISQTFIRLRRVKSM